MKNYDFYVYIVSNYSRTVLYTGFTNNLARRLFEHETGACKGFTKKYKAKYLLYFKHYNNVFDAIAREKQIKGWKREKKIELIKTLNPDLSDLGKEMYEEE